MIKKVAFAEDEKEKTRVDKMQRAREIEFIEFKELLMEEVKKIRKEKVEIEKVRIEVCAIAKEVEERLLVVENKVKEWEKERKAWVEAQSVRSEVTNGSEGGSQWSLRSGGAAVV